MNKEILSIILLVIIACIYIIKVFILVKKIIKLNQYIEDLERNIDDKNIQIARLKCKIRKIKDE